MALTLPYPTPIISFPVSYGTRPDASKSGHGPAVVPMVFPFTVTVNAFTVAMQTTFPGGLPNIQTLYIDNSTSATRTTVMLPISGETIVAEPFTKGFYPACSNALTMTVSNPTTVAISVAVSAFNFIIPPVVTNASQLALGSNDQVLPVRLPTLIANQIINLGSGVPVQLNGFVGSPYYFISAVNIMIQTPADATGEVVGLSLYDSLNGGASAAKDFWQGICTSTSSAANANLCNLSGLCMGGSGTLWMSGGAASPTFGNCLINVYGGTTSALF